MKKLFIAVFLLATITFIFSSSFSEIDLIMDSMKGKPKKEMFKVFHYVHKKTYSLDSEEGMNRYKIFKQNLKWVEVKNRELGKKVYGITQFMDITDEEFRQTYLMNPVTLEKQMKSSEFKKAAAKASQNNEGRKNTLFQLDEDEKIELNVSQTPSSIDWRPFMNPAKDQKSCGSCWAFAAMSAVEGNVNLQLKYLPDLSEQYLVDCDTKDNGCQGGMPTDTFEWLKSNGVVNQKDFPYTAKQTLCKESEFRSLRKNLVKNYRQCDSDCSKNNWLDLLAKGPIVVAMDASDEGFSKYKPQKEEPWKPKACGRVNHAVTAVGYVIENNQEYLIVRNSWGTNWGFQGYFKISVEESCGIIDQGWLPEIQPAETPFSEPICPTFWSECNYSGKSISTCDGVSDFKASIGGKFSSFNTNNSSTKNFNFFTQPNCKGEGIWNSGNIECDKDDYAFRTKSILSASPYTYSLPYGCFLYSDKPCYDGKKTLICNSITDLAASKFRFTPGSIYSRSQSIKSVIFFEDVKFTGKGFGIKDLLLANTEEIAGLNEALLKAKSLVIIKKNPLEPMDPDW